MLPDVAKVRSILGGFEIRAESTTLGVIVHVAAADAPEVLGALKDSDLDFAMLVDLLGDDTGDAVGITYHLRSFSRDEDLYIKTVVAYDGVLCSVWNAYASALLPERETAELFGLTLSGHPNPKRLLTTEGEEPLLRTSVPIRTLEEVRDR